MILYFVRHAMAGEKYSNSKKDESRPLDQQGIEQCRYVGRALAAMNVTVDAILTSPLKRATQTASAIANEIGFEGSLTKEKALRPEASYEDFRDMLERYNDAEALMIVGHNPNESEFLRTILGGTERLGLDMKKGSVAKVEWKRRTGDLQFYFTPRVARSLYDAAVQESPALIDEKFEEPAEQPDTVERQVATGKRGKKDQSASTAKSRPKISRK